MICAFGAGKSGCGRCGGRGVENRKDYLLYAGVPRMLLTGVMPENEPSWVGCVVEDVRSI